MPQPEDADDSSTPRPTALRRRFWDIAGLRPGRPQRRRPRRAVVVVCWLLAAAVAVATLIRVAELDRGALGAQIAAFTPYAIPLAVISLIAALLGRQVGPALLTFVAGAVLVACMVPRATADNSAVISGGVPLIVMSSNLRLGGGDADAIVAVVREANVDVLALQEYTPAIEDRLVAAGLSQLLPYRQNDPRRGALGSAVYSRFALSEGGVRKASAQGHDQAFATVMMPGAHPFTVESVHPVPPIDSHLYDYWLTGLGNQIPATASPHPRILIGDFNATPDHHALRDVLATGYRDAADLVGAGLTPTWPYYGPRAAVTPKITLDHVLLPAGFGVRDFRAVTIPGTDHRAIIATVLVP